MHMVRAAFSCYDFYPFPLAQFLEDMDDILSYLLVDDFSAIDSVKNLV